MPKQPIEISAEEDAGFEVPPTPVVQASSPPAPPAPPKEVIASAAPDEDPLPQDLKASFELLKEAQDMPTRNAAEEAVRDARLKLVRAHVHRLQQGLPDITVDADSIAASSARNAANLKADRLELLARQMPEVRELLNENQRLVAALNKRK